MPTRPHPGLTIDGFTLGEKLHSGGFATIWAVTHPDHGQPMVMKVPTILDGYDGPTIVGFEVEQMIMPRLTGPHVPRVFGVGDFSVMPYLVVERIEGESFLRLFQRAPLPLSDVVEIAARMVDAVADLHRQHVIHLDLKPENFLQRQSGEMVLVDYGLSRHDHLPDLLAEEFSIPMGTFPYLAPEQYLRCRDDPRSDLFALGALLYVLTTGKHPFGQPETLRGVRKRLWRDPEPPRALRSECPEWLQEIILRALAVDPMRRYQSAAQLAFDLGHPQQVRLTARALKVRRDGWLSVGEVGRREAGYLYLHGRAGRMVTVADHNVFPEEIEALMHGMPGILRAAVVPVPDTRRGHVLVAMVMGDPALEATILTRLRRELGALKAPKALIWLSDWPLLPSGKTDLRALEAQAKWPV